MTHPITIFCSGNYRTSATRCVWLSQQHTQLLPNDFCFGHDPFNSMSAIHPPPHLYKCEGGALKRRQESGSKRIFRTGQSIGT